MLGRVRLDASRRDRALPASFLGFSQEYNLVPSWVGTYQTGVNSVLARLFTTLGAAGNGTPLLRVGGGTTDGASWNPTGKPHPKSIYFGIDYPWTQGLSAFLRATHAPVILGLNFAQRKVSIAVDWAKAAMKLLPRGSIREFEVGNEPDIYSTRPFNVESKHPGFTRPRDYDPRRYLREAVPFLAALHRAVPKARLAGPALCCAAKWVAAMPAILASTHRYLSLVTVHRYPVNACGVRPGHGGYPSPASLLAPANLFYSALQFYGLSALTRHYRLGLRLDETNSAACGGAAGVSNTFASALWAANWLFAMNAARLQGVDFHGSSGLYTPFSFRFSSGVWSGHVQPEFYGMLMFAEATAHHARWLPRTHIASAKRGTNIWSWGFYDPVDHVMRVALLNMGSRATGTVAFEAGSQIGTTATVERLTAPRLGAIRGISWAGRHYADITDGTLLGSARIQHLRRRPRHPFLLSVSPASGVLLTVPYRSG